MSTLIPFQIELFKKPSIPTPVFCFHNQDQFHASEATAVSLVVQDQP
jgi:hypothetical protein